MSETNVSSTPAEATPSAPASPAATPQAPAPQSATPTAPTPAPATQGQQPPEGWVPSYRVRETREAALREAQTQWQAKEREYQQRMAQVQSQLHALVGVQPPANPEVEQVRSQFSQLYPGLAKLEERAQDVMGVLERAGDLDSQTNHYWQSYGRQVMDRLFDRASESLGAPLTEAGKRQLHASFTGFVSSSPELTARYANDPTIVDDFWKDFTSSFIDPARRVTAAGVATRTGAPLPQSSPSGIPGPASAPKPANMDERAAQAWSLYNQPKT